MNYTCPTHPTLYIHSSTIQSIVNPLTVILFNYLFFMSHAETSLLIPLFYQTHLIHILPLEWQTKFHSQNYSFIKFNHKDFRKITGI